MTEKVFITPDHDGPAYGGYFFRSEIHQHIKKLNDYGLNVVGIIITPGEWTAELLTDKPPETAITEDKK